MRYCGKYGIAREATDNNTIRRMRIAYWIIRLQALGMCNINCFSMTTMVTQSRLGGTLYVRCVSC
jgi:hypothetical protein